MDALLLSGLGLFAAAYDQLVMAPATAALREQLLYSALAAYNATTTSDSDSEWEHTRDAVAAAGVAGIVVGQLAFGVVGDVFGRRRPLLVTSALLTLGAVLSAAATSATGGSSSHLVAMLAAGRVLIGLGIGGEYPLGTTATAEHSVEWDAATRTQRVVRLWTLSMSAAAVAAAFLGNLLAQALAMGDPGENALKRLEVVWRMLLAIGAAPAALVCYYRLMALETEEEPAAFVAARDKGHMTHQSGSVATVHRPGARLLFIARHYWRPLLGCAGSWFAWGVLSTAPTLLARRLLLAVVADSTATPSHDDGWGMALQIWTSQNAFSALLTLPGYLLASYLTPSRHLGRSRLQLAGFLLLAVEFLLLGLFWNQVSVHDSGQTAPTTEEIVVMLVALVLASLVGTGGPATTTFVLPAEMFPTAIGSTCFGVAAAAGRLGAAIGTFVVTPALQSTMRGSSFAFAVTAMIGASVTWLCCSDCDLSFDERDEQLERRLVRDANRVQRRTSTLNQSRRVPDADAQFSVPVRWNGGLSASSSDQQDNLGITERIRRRFAIDSGEIVHYEEMCGTPGTSNAATFA